MASYVAKGQDFKVLDHGYIKIIDWMGSDESIIEAARMSTGKGFQGWAPGERCRNCRVRRDEDHPEECPMSIDGMDSTDPSRGSHQWEKISGDMNLLDYLWRNGHATPFEMCELHVEVCAPILVFRQWHRHRTFSYNEASARYAKMSSDHYLPELDRLKPKMTANKQESGSSGTATESTDWEDVRGTIQYVQDEIYSEYNALLEYGVPNETARINTPVSRYSKCRVKTDLRNWLGFLKLRMHPHAQWEIRQYANIIGNEIIGKIWPRAWSVFEEHTLYGTSFSRTEMDVIQQILLTDKFDWEGMAEERGLKGSLLEEFKKKITGAGQT